MTPAEESAVEHVKANARMWRWSAAEILSNAELHAALDPYQLARLPELMQAEINKAKARKEAP